MNGRQAHRTSTLALSLLMVAIGVALVVQAAAGSGVFSPRMLIGVLFVAAGCGRGYVEIRRGQSR
jgi:hypothetical protein